MRPKDRRILPVLLVALVVCGVLLGGCARREVTLRPALFSWHSSALEQPDELLSCMEEQGLGALYQSFSRSLPEEKAGEMLAAAAKGKIEVFLLTGDPSWGLDPDGAALLGEVERAAALGVRGVVLDVEPYLVPEWDDDPEGVMETTVSALTTAYRAAREKGLAVILCVPYFYDTWGLEDPLRRLIADACDGVAVMNYYRRDEAEHLAGEAALAAEYGKPIQTIYELQEPGRHGLGEKNTYYGLGLDAVAESWNTLKGAYPDMTYALHEYEALKEAMRLE